MANKFYVTINSSKRERFRGEDEQSYKILAIGFFYEIKLPRDVATGLTAGKPQYSLIKITKAVDSFSPQIFEALIKNEVLTSVLFEFIQFTAEGKEEVYYTIELTNSSISGLKQYLDETKQATNLNCELEEVFFTFQAIKVEHKITKISASDSWSAGNSWN